MNKVAPQLRLFGEVVFFVGVWLVADLLVRWLGLPTPAGVVGLALVTLLLFTGVLPSRTLMAGAQWLLAEMLLFFMPSLMAITDYTALIRQEGIVLLIVLVLGCLIVMAGTAWVVDATLKFERKLHTRHER